MYLISYNVKCELEIQRQEKSEAAERSEESVKLFDQQEKRRELISNDLLQQFYDKKSEVRIQIDIN